MEWSNPVQLHVEAGLEIDCRLTAYETLESNSPASTDFILERICLNCSAKLTQGVKTRSALTNTPNRTPHTANHTRLYFDQPWCSPLCLKRFTYNSETFDRCILFDPSKRFDRKSSTVENTHAPVLKRQVELPAAHAHSTCVETFHNLNQVCQV